MFAAKIDAALRGGQLPPWRDPVHPARIHPWPVNAMTGRLYTGRNALSLLFQGRQSPLWGTRNTWERLGATVASDAVPVPVYVTVTQEGHARFRREYLVFNESQVSGGRRPTRKDADAIAAMARIIASARPTFRRGPRPRYFWGSDTIEMPPADCFESETRYLRVKLHELAHWTGHPLRLDRAFGRQGTWRYAREELVAELTSMQVAAILNISDPHGEQEQQHLAYVSMWWDTIPASDSRTILAACKDASRATKYLLTYNKSEKR